MAIAFHTLTVADVRPETPDAVSVAFAVPPELADDYGFHPGQHLTLRTTLDGEDCRRSYSICTAPGDGELRVAIKKDGRFSTWANEQLKTGDRIDVMTPQGRFGIAADPARARVYLAVAAGSGITPIMSLARTLLAEEPRSRFSLIYGNRTSQSIIFKDAIEDLKDRYLDRLTVHHLLSREQQDIALLNGRIDAGKIAALLSPLAAPIDHAFLCGPGGLIEESRRALTGLGLPAEAIHLEYFSADGAPVAPRQPAAASADAEPREAIVADAQITLNGAVHVVPMRAGETIIDAGLRHGLDMPYSCRGGMCCTCRAMLVDGAVAMDVNYSLEPWELEAGFVLTCQSHPQGRRVVVDYDQA